RLGKDSVCARVRARCGAQPDTGARRSSQAAGRMSRLAAARVPLSRLTSTRMATRAGHAVLRLAHPTGGGILSSRHNEDNQGIPDFFLRVLLSPPRWVALPLTVAKLTCNENGDPDILLLVRFHAPPGGAWHGSHDSILPQSALPCQRPHWQGQYRYPFAEGTAVHLPRVP